MTTTIANLNYALAKKEYKLIQLCELYVYEDCQPIFRDFIHSVESSINKFDEINPRWRKLLKKGLNSAYGIFPKGQIKHLINYAQILKNSELCYAMKK